VTVSFGAIFRYADGTIGTPFSGSCAKSTSLASGRYKATSKPPPAAALVFRKTRRFTREATEPAAVMFSLLGCGCFMRRQSGFVKYFSEAFPKRLGLFCSHR
jgi:hypothetical protein